MVIASKRDYEYYLEADRIALGRERPSWMMRIARTVVHDEVWDFERLLRRLEYVRNCRRNGIGIVEYAVLRQRLHSLQVRLGFVIPLNVFGPGLSISHPGPIILNGAARVGANCRIHPCVVVGPGDGPAYAAPHIGDNVYIGPGVKVFGGIEVADNIAIGANSVVNSSFTEPGITIAGVPARKVSDAGSCHHVVRATDIIRQRELARIRDDRSQTGSRSPDHRPNSA